MVMTVGRVMAVLVVLVVVMVVVALVLVKHLPLKGEVLLLVKGVLPLEHLLKVARNAFRPDELRPYSVV